MPDEIPPKQGKVSGRLIVLILFSSALIMWGIVFMVGLRQKEANRTGAAPAEAVDSAVTAEEVRAWLKALPETWTRVSQVEGQGWVLYIPCYSSNASLSIRTAADSLPGLACEFCDSLGSYAVRGIRHTRADSVWELRLDPPTGSLRILPVTDSLLRNFPEAPFKGKLMLWTRPREGGRTDSMVFVPKPLETEFETLRAEDENPEGCGGGADEGAGESGAAGDSAAEANPAVGHTHPD
jgi:hypothetical protein